MRESKVVRFAEQDREAVAHTLTDAFLHGAVPEWLVPDPQTRQHVFSRYFNLYAGHLLEHGLVYGTADLSSVACWLDLTGPIHPPEIEDLDRRLFDACGQEWITRFTQLHDLFDQAHPSQRPHWYLVLIGVRNRWQGQGLGSALLAHHHDVLDKEGHAAYLDSSSLANHRLYLRHGYEDLGVRDLPDDGPPIWPMWRPARTQDGITQAGIRS